LPSYERRVKSLRSIEGELLDVNVVHRLDWVVEEEPRQARFHG
jgi:hypothetical protein